jgi:tryptophan-rich sensory protein
MDELPDRPGRCSFWLALAGFLVLTFAVAAVGGAVTASSVQTWYPTLNKPAFNPPDWIFGPVWTALYGMMAVSAALVWSGARPPARRTAITWFLIQLSLNLGWSLLFFGLQQVAFAFGWLILLWLAIAMTIRCFWRISSPAALLLLPYLAWVSFAGLLNFLIWRLN